MECSDSVLTLYALRLVLCVSGILVIVLMQKAEHDKSINRVDSAWFRNARRASFMAIAGAVVVVLLSNFNPLALLLLFASTSAVLIVDIIALQNRPPANGHPHAIGVRSWAPLRSLLALFRHSSER
jgi:hypothetical protein